MCIRDRGNHIGGVAVVDDTVCAIGGSLADTVVHKVAGEPLYNAPSTMNHYYQQEVQHDMYGGGWNEKNIG